MADLPLFPLAETVVFPGMTLPLHIYEERYKTMVRDLVENEKRRFVLVLARSQAKLSDAVVAAHAVGSYVDLLSVGENPDGTFNILVHGQDRCFVKDIDTQGHPYFSVPDLPYPLQRGDPNAEQVAAWDALEAFRHYAKKAFGDEALAQIEAAMPADPTHQASFICANLRVPAASRQVLLEAPGLIERFQLAQKLIEEVLPTTEAPTQVLFEEGEELD